MTFNRDNLRKGIQMDLPSLKRIREAHQANEDQRYKTLQEVAASKTFYSACVITAEVSTNCPQGGDTGHGGRTLVRIYDDGGANITPIEIRAGGDCEAKILADALIWIGKELKRQYRNNMV